MHICIHICPYVCIFVNICRYFCRFYAYLYISAYIWDACSLHRHHTVGPNLWHCELEKTGPLGNSYRKTKENMQKRHAQTIVKQTHETAHAIFVGTRCVFFSYKNATVAMEPKSKDTMQCHTLGLVKPVETWCR